MMTHVSAILPKAPLTGIRGWLIWLGLGMILSPIKTIYQLFTYYGNKDTLAVFQTAPIAMTGELIINLLWLSFICYITVVFFGEKRIFKKVFTIGVFSYPIVVLFDYLWLSAMSGIPLATFLKDPSSAGQLGQSIGYSIVAIPWVAYVWRSRRVANTFVR